MRPLCEGVRWSGTNFEFKSEWEVEDILAGETDQKRTTDQMVAAMSAIIGFLQFEP